MPESSRTWMEAEEKAVAQAQSVVDAAKMAAVVSTAEQVEAADVTTGAALFDLSSYTGGAPLIPMGDGATGVEGPSAGAAADASHGMFEQDAHELMDKSSYGEEKKMGRPSHPAWQYFIRGEKRNRFHHNAYCRFCNENGEEPVAVRGVSGNMIRHLQKCIYCPAEVVTQLKLLCAQKDAASFNKRHQSQNRSVDVFLQETSPAPKKKSRRNEDEGEANTLPLRNTPLRGPETLAAKASIAQDTTGVEDFMPLQLPLLSSEMNGGLTTTLSSSKSLSYEVSLSTPQKSDVPTKPRTEMKHGKPRAPQSHRPNELHVNQRTNSESDADNLSKLVVSSTLSMGMPWDWMWTEQSSLVFGDQNSKVEPPNAELLSTLGTASHEKQIMKMKDEQVGVTLAVNWWATKYPRSNFVLLSLVNALGEATSWELIDMGIGDSTPDTLAEKIKDNLANLRKRGIHVINIVAATTLTYAASRLAVSSSEWTSLAIPVLPCYSHVLQMLLGAVLTGAGHPMETIGEVIELVQMFSNHRVLKVLRRECGDPDAVLHAPTRHNWHSFIEAVDSVRQYEDMIKIIASKVVRASSDSAGRALNRPGTANSRKDSAGNTVDELAECGLSTAVIRTIQNAVFWENVVALSELMSPIKEAYKMMSSTFASSFSLSDIFYQFGRMHQQYGIILSDCEDTAGGGRSVEQVRFVLRKVNDMWKLYDQPLMVLGYTFNYTLQLQFLARHQSSLQWLSIGKYAKQYFRGWFCAASSTRNPSRLLVLSDEAAAQFTEDILAFKERKYPFDSESMCDFDNPKFFYMLVSDSHPLMHMFGSRLFSFVTSTPPLGDVLPGKCFIPSVPSTTCPQQTLLPLLRMKLFAHTALRPSKDLLGFVHSNKPKGDTANMTSGYTHLDHSESMSEAEEGSSPFLPNCSSAGRPKMGDFDDKPFTLDRIWNKKQWEALAKAWKTHWEKEIDTSNLLQTSRVLDSFTQDLTLDQIFKEALPSRLPHDREDAVVDV
ncbi:hypothetical protein Pcac1_g1822 [Phytophthora cactorum]|uniref:BED-type domain-containing protein n=1 Tax=Phytophthora cactorum TaxID=29920 RepID=A0A329SDR6_9STRA|nr:hypothetical protein Pcac1_g1822 [Phytophthora cactorum]RAW34799.1 hypothetical protein PC110_g8904 [Phytophthora cactorum]